MFIFNGWHVITKFNTIVCAECLPDVTFRLCLKLGDTVKFWETDVLEEIKHNMEQVKSCSFYLFNGWYILPGHSFIFYAESLPDNTFRMCLEGNKIWETDVLQEINHNIAQLSPYLFL